ncbi:MAG: DUF58 domain-containing protein [Bacteroidia bacterium]|nr:DUF58 domain-containing protein [Bacteroidia bacterium]
MELWKVIQRVERLRWQLLKPVQSLLVGPYRSTFRGEGIEFADTRPYEVGDDWRRIHWSLTARKNQPYLRLGQEERELTCLIAIDRSRSMLIAPDKEALTLTAAVALALSAVLNGDRVRWVSFAEKVEWFSPACKGEKLIWGYLAHLWRRPVQGHRSYLSPLLQWIGAMHKRRILLVLLSDLFFHDKEGWTLLRGLSQRHFVLVIGLHSPQEAFTPAWGYLPVREVEEGHAFISQGGTRSSLPLLASLRGTVIYSEEALLPSLREVLLPPLQ